MEESVLNRENRLFFLPTESLLLKSFCDSFNSPLTEWRSALYRKKTNKKHSSLPSELPHFTNATGTPQVYLHFTNCCQLGAQRTLNTSSWHRLLLWRRVAASFINSALQQYNYQACRQERRKIPATPCRTHKTHLVGNFNPISWPCVWFVFLANIYTTVFW